ncbi:hypothetical protein VTN77DRAFT_5616 [Rasamsonia byssochlamydoides]|uniref:uncharacterized protein n=1 Tax=Rasamsonia byssochlamydoides TaxID=89139 RepID=UPI003742C62E
MMTMGQMDSFLRNLLLVLCSFLFINSSVLAQFPPSPDLDPDIKTIISPVDGNITIRYKSPPAGTCQTVFSSQKQYTGYVTLPPYALAPVQQNYSINTFFWFVEARTDPATAPLTIFINGGPGSSSMVGLFQEVGPCEVVEISTNELGTQAREWGWDRSSNLLFIDQPNQVGFSYDVLRNGSLNLLSEEHSFPPADVPSGQPAYTFLNGTFSSNSTESTANTTAIAAGAAWHIVQGFLGAFPQYNPAQYPSSTNQSQTAPVGINLFTESYGGKYGPAFAAFWEEQNERLRNGEFPPNTTLEIQLSSLGILQGCVDDLVQGPFYPKFAYDNTYGIQAISLQDQQDAASAFYAQDGCQQQILACRNAVAALDPDDYGDNSDANALCAAAQRYCNDYVIGPYFKSGLSPYDISQSVLDPFPPNTYLEYLNTAAVQSAIGVPVNFTSTSGAVVAAFQQTGDYERGDQIADLAALLEKGVRVALVYGDRDFICNWKGGEAVSFSIAASAPSYLSSFNSAGYAPIITNTTYIGGVVRQAGNLSFSRIYDAGHLIAAYQPETLFTLFTRIILGSDLSSGAPADLSTFGTSGDANATATNSAPPMASPTCCLRSVLSTCDERQLSQLRAGEDVIINGILYDKASDWKLSDGDESDDNGDSGIGPVGVPGTASVNTNTAAAAGSGDSTVPTTRSTAVTSSNSISAATGVFTATSTPSMVWQRSSSTAASCRTRTRPTSMWMAMALMMICHLILFYI